MPFSRPTRRTRAPLTTAMTQAMTTTVTRTDRRRETLGHPEITQLRMINKVEQLTRHLRHLVDHLMVTVEAMDQVIATTSKTPMMMSRRCTIPRAEMNVASPVVPHI